jgi:hypothetical protein
MTRNRQRLVPLLVVALLALTVCAVSLAHAETNRGDMCIGAKAAHESPILSIVDSVAVPLGAVSLVPPDRPVRIHLVDASRGCAHRAASEPRTPRAPPTA